MLLPKIAYEVERKLAPKKLKNMNPEKEKWILLVFLSLIWGSSFILIKKSLEHFNPYQVGALRVLISGGFTLADCFIEHQKVS